MMARLLDEAPAAPVSPSPGGMSEPNKTHHVPARKLSFKTRQASRGTYRATKVSLSSSNVALIASKFNTIVIDDDTQGRALFRKLSLNQRKPSVSKDMKTRQTKPKAEGVVKAAIEIFEHNDSEKIKNGKPPLRKGNDSRPKLFVVRKSSSKSSIDIPKMELSKTLSKESSKDNNTNCTEQNEGDRIELSTRNTDVKEVKRKPSLKAKPDLRHSGSVKQLSKNTLNQCIAKFNNIDSSTNRIEKRVSNNDVRKPNFSLNDRIAQFSKSEKLNTVEDKKVNKNPQEANLRLTILSEEKENKHKMSKSILRNTKNKQPGLVEKTKDKLATIIQENNSANQQSKPNSNFNTHTKQSLIKDKFIVSEKELKVFPYTPDDKSTDLQDELNNRLSVPKDGTILANVFDDKSPLDLESSHNKKVTSLKSDDSPNLVCNQEQNLPNLLQQSNTIKTIVPAKKELPLDFCKANNQVKLSSPTKESCSLTKSQLSSCSSESPKLEKRTLCVAPDPTVSLQLDKIKPNNSFLWKSTSRINVVTEVPIYDDRPESQRHDNVFENECIENSLMETESKEDYDIDDGSKTTDSLNLDVANSFILEMTEQIDRRFSSGSAQEKDFEETNFRTSLEGMNNDIVVKNSSFLHGKNSYDDVFASATNLNKANNIFNVNNKPDGAKTTKIPPPVYKKTQKVRIEESVPQLPEKRPKISGEFGEDLNLNPPPVPPSHTKPKVTHTLSEETWLKNCKKILEIPPPLRKRNAEDSSDSSATLQLRRVQMLDQGRSQSEKRFSVSQVELLRRMSEMNLSNKRNSLPPDTFSLSSTYVEPDEEDHYSSIHQFEKISIPADNQDTYEAIGENNYAEINEYEEEVGGDSEVIYDDVIGQEQEPDDHYEAINCALVQGDSDSSCDQSNSLYGLARPVSLTVPGAVYQATGGSETSDEWVDMDNSDDQRESVLIFREKERGRGLVATESWSMKVRRQWSRQAADGDDGSDESVPRSYENIETADETPYCDDFDDSFSDSSFENEAINPHVQVEEKRPQPLSEGIYGLMKQAGQRMRKHWSLGKSLTRMRKNKSAPNVIQSSTNLGRRGWSFKSKDKASTANSTFYLHSTNTLPRTDSQPETKLDPRRLSTASMVARPTSPPPPPPPPRNSVDDNGKRKSYSNSPINSSGDNEGYVEGQRRLSRNGNSMWYIDTSTDTASEHGSSQGSDLNLRFADEPLYQFYAANIAEMTLSQLAEGDDSDGYEEITPTATPVLDLRSLWCQLPQVQNSRVLDTLSQSQKRLQEAKFEVVTSEASYFKSLTVLDKLFASCPLFSDENILSRSERKILFGNVHTVRKCSEKLLAALQVCWQDCILLQGICDVVHDHVNTYKEVYVKYCTSQISMDRTLKLLKQTNSNFSTVLQQLESDPECQSLTLYSFLMLPMQRITRLRLLIETMLSIMDPGDSDFMSCQKALDALNKCVTECNEGARRQERLEEMVRLSKQLEFPTEMSIPILGGNSRWLVRSGQVTQVNMDAKHTFGRRLSRTGPKFTLFLFTDLFLLTKKKSEESYLVVDHCQRSLLEARDITDFPGNNRFLLQLTLLENADNKTVEMTVSCENETDRQRWLQVLTPPQSEEPGETLYQDWDCPQVTMIHAYQPSQPDELALSLGDIVNVLRKSEGWFYGERTRDGEKGWFPGNYTREIASKHVRARNLKQRYRLLQLSADLVQQQKKVKS